MIILDKEEISKVSGVVDSIKLEFNDKKELLDPSKTFEVLKLEYGYAGVFTHIHNIMLDVLKNTDILMESADINTTSKTISSLVLKNTSGTASLCNILSKFGLSVQEFTLSLITNKDNVTLKVPAKIYKILESCNSKTRTQLVERLYYTFIIYKLLYTLQLKYTVDSTTNEIIFKEGIWNLFKKEYSRYTNDFINKSVIVDAEKGTSSLISTDVHSVVYDTNAFNSPKAYTSNMPTKVQHEYTVLSNDYEKVLLINLGNDPDAKSLIELKTFYLLDLNNKAMYTNTLSENLEVLQNGILGYVIRQFRYLCASKIKIYKVNSLNEVSSMLKKFKSASADADVFSEVIISKIPKINEITDFKFLKKAGLLDDHFRSEYEIYDHKVEYLEDPYAMQILEHPSEDILTYDLKSLNDIVRGVSNGDIYSMLFYGNAGTGKSTAARVLPYRCSIPYVSINCSQNIEEADIIGTMIPNPYKKCAEDPEFIWKDGILTNAIRKGYCCILEELNGARPGILMKLNSLLDGNRQMDLPTGEVVIAHKNFRLIGTSNIIYEGTNRFNKALIDRFDLCVEFKDLSRSELFKLIKIKTKYTNENTIYQILDIYFAVKKYSNEQNLDLTISIRRLFNVFKQYKYYKSAKECIICTLLNHAFIEENEHLNNFVDNILGAYIKDLKF